MKLTRRDLFRRRPAPSAAARRRRRAGRRGRGRRRRARSDHARPRRSGTGPAGAGGYRADRPGRRRAPRRAHRPRRSRARRGRAPRRKPLLAFAQLSDVHIVDAQSPMRVEYVDRYDDEDEPGDPTPGIFGSAYRPQEVLTAQIAEAMVREINQIGAGPVTGKPLAFAIQTGDNSDNSPVQRDPLEHRRPRRRGDPRRLRRPDPVRGRHGRRPDLLRHPLLAPRRHPGRARRTTSRAARTASPTVPGLLDAARRPFQASGLGMPWYTALGNHDPLAQGNFPSTMQLNTVAVGPLKMISPPTGVSQADVLNALRGNYADFVAAFAATPHVRQVTPDPIAGSCSGPRSSRSTSPPPALPVGHGFTEDNRTDGHGVLHLRPGVDPVPRDGHRQPERRARTARSTSRSSRGSRSSCGRRRDKLVVVASHHTVVDDGQPAVGTGGDPSRGSWATSPGRGAPRARQRHRLGQRPHPRQPDPGPPRGDGGGFWEINTASHIDWPQQARLIEVARQRRRHPVDLLHDGRPRRAASYAGRLRRGDAAGRAVPRCWRPTTGRSATRTAAASATTATSSCWCRRPAFMG